MQPIYVPFHGHRRLSSTSRLTPRSNSITSMMPIIDLVRTIQTHVSVENPFSSTFKGIEQTANEALIKSRTKQEDVTKKRRLLQPTNTQWEKPSTSEWRFDALGYSAIINDMTLLMTPALEHLYSNLRESSIQEAQLHYKSKTNYFDSHPHIKFADRRFGVSRITSRGMTSDIRTYSLISRTSDLHKLRAGEVTGQMISLSTSLNPIFSAFRPIILGLQSQNNSIINNIIEKVQTNLAPSAAIHASFSPDGRFNHMLLGRSLNMSPSLADSIIAQKNLFSRLLGIFDRPNQRSYQHSNLLLSHTVQIEQSRDRSLPIVTNQLNNSASNAEVSNLTSAFSINRVGNIVTRGRYQVDNSVFDTFLSGSNWMNMFVTSLIQSMTIHTPWIYPISDSRPYATEPGLLKSVEVTPTLISRKGNHFFNFALSIFDNLQFYSLDNSSQVNFLPSFTQFTKLGHEILGNAQALLPEHSAKQSDYFKISTIDQVKKLFDLNNLMIQKPLLTRIRLANMISSPFNFVRAGFQSDFYNKFQKGENSYSYLVSVASSKSSAPIEKLIEMSASHVILDSTIASPLNRAVLTSSMVSQATIAHRIKSQQTEGNSDYWLTDSNIKPNPIENDFVLSSDHPLQPTSFVNMTEELKGSNHGKHLAKIGKELHQDSGLGLFRTRIEQIFNRESSKYSDLQNNLSLADQFSLKYNDNLDENAVPDVKDGQHDEEELEIRILTRKIEQLLNEELRRHGPIIW